MCVCEARPVVFLTVNATPTSLLVGVKLFAGFGRQCARNQDGLNEADHGGGAVHNAVAVQMRLPQCKLIGGHALVVQAFLEDFFLPQQTKYVGFRAVIVRSVLLAVFNLRLFSPCAFLPA